MRKNLFELLEDGAIDFYREYERLNYYFCDNDIHSLGWDSVYYNYTLKKYIDKYLFEKLSFRGSCINIDDLLEEVDFFDCDNIEDLLLYCEILYNIIEDLELLNSDLDEIVGISNNILNNIKKILNVTNNKIIKDEKGFIIVADNISVNVAASLVDDKLALSILKYNYFDIKGKIDLKKNILLGMGRYIEPKMKEKILKKMGYEFLQTDISFMLNNFNLRHNNKEGSNKKDFIVMKSEEEIEIWYDKLYKMMVAAIIITDNYNVHNEIKKIKDEYKW